MRKLFFLIFLLCFSVTFAAAQKTVRKRPKGFTIQSTGQTSNDLNQESNQTDLNQTTQSLVNSSRVDSPLKILEKPRPPLFPDGQDCSQGIVVLRVTFLASGEIGTISVISGLTKSKTEASVKAAKKIKFQPAIKDGKPVNVTKIVQYVFSLY